MGMLLCPAVHYGHISAVYGFVEGNAYPSAGSCGALRVCRPQCEGVVGFPPELSAISSVPWGEVMLSKYKA